MPRKRRGCRNYWACRARSPNSTARSPIALPTANSTCKRPGLPITSGRPPWTSSPSTSRITRRIGGSWRAGMVSSSLRGATATKQSISCSDLENGLLRGACHRAALCADPLARNDGGEHAALRLPSHPLRRAVFGKRLRPLDVILRRRHRLHGRIVALLGDRLLQRHRKALLDRLLGGADRHRAVLADGFRPALGRRQGFALRHHLIDKTELVAFARADVARGEDHAHGALQPDLARQPMQSAGQRGEADARLGQREYRILRGDDEVAGQRDLKTAAHRDTVDGGDDRLVAVEARVQSGKPAGIPAALSPRRLPFQVVAGTKRLVAGAGDDRDPLLGIGGKIVEHLVQLEMRVGMQRVVNLGPRQRHDRDRGLARDLAKFQVHVCSLIFSVARNADLNTSLLPPSGATELHKAPPRRGPLRLLDLAFASHLNRWRRAFCAEPATTT